MKTFAVETKEPGVTFIVEAYNEEHAKRKVQANMTEVMWVKFGKVIKISNSVNEYGYEIIYNL